LKLTVSSSLEGRDLAVIKSLINIQNIFGELHLTFLNDVDEGMVMIAKDQFGSDSVYFALNRITGHKHLIEPDLNPQSVRALFESLATEKMPSAIDKPATEIITTRQFIWQQSKAESQQNLWISHGDLLLVMDAARHKVYANQPLSYDCIKQFSQLCISDIHFKHGDKNIPADFNHSVKLETFKWLMGYSLNNALINEKHRSPEYAFKQVSWPDYGSYAFKKEFIRLSSLLVKQPETCDELIRKSGFGEAIVLQFLNATSMTGHVVVTAAPSSPAKPTEVKDSGFLSSLKKLFSI